MNVPCEIDYDDIEVEDEEDADGIVSLMPGVRVTCTRCGQCAENTGTDANSIICALNKLNSWCPKREKNHYYSDDT